MNKRKLFLLLGFGVLALLMWRNKVVADDGCPGNEQCVYVGSVVDKFNCYYSTSSNQCESDYVDQVSYDCSADGTCSPTSGPVCSSNDSCVSCGDYCCAWKSSPCSPPGCCEADSGDGGDGGDTHNECSGESCVSVDGAGTDECSSNADCAVCNAGTPDVLNLSSPSDGESLNVVEVTLDWDAISSWGHSDTPDCSYSDSYEVYVEAGDTSPDTQVASVGSGTTSYDFTGSSGETYYWMIVANNGHNQTGSLVRSFQTANVVEGTVYDDPTNACSTSTESNFGGGMTAELELGGTTYSDSVAGDGTFGIVAPAGSGYTLNMTIPTGYVCSNDPLCGNCPTQTSVTSPSLGNNFFFTQLRDPWWQVDGGAIYAGIEVGGTAIKSNIPVSAPQPHRCS